MTTASTARRDRRQGPAPAALHLSSRPGRIGVLRLHQLALVEVAAALVLIGAAAGRAVLVPCSVVAAVLVAAAVVRRRGRPLPEWLTSVMAMRRRQREAAREAAREPGTPGGAAIAAASGLIDPALAPITECDPALRTYTFSGRRRDRSVGMVGDGTFLTAVLLVQSRDEPLRTARPMPLGLLYDALEIDDIALASVQVVQHVQPAPAPHLPPQAVAAVSYGPLQAQYGTPAIRVTWVALKLDPELCPEAVLARGGGLGGAQRAVLRAADHVASRLAGAGFEASVLDEEELTAALATSAGVNPLATALAGRIGTGQRRTLERSRAWRCDDRWHTTYWVGRWPQGGGALPTARTVTALTAVPAMAGSFALTLSRGTGRSPALSAYVRITARDDRQLTSARRELERVARQHKVGLVRLDREQLPGVLATLPLGGTS
ncbi:type VII secretion protein EccE [Streptomyces sp. NBC_01477]|uniref:type VII secretion protein EccE n=1 Tax=Streptomyces sp. NBC_01477 TaxID=2976015 RepID=UPI002E333426|nr:type VII secretion protein EccE [Streptomyces sp. NBC_01477]